MSILTHVGYAINQYATMNCESVIIAHLISVKTVQINTEKIMSNIIHFVVLNVLERVKIKHELVTTWGCLLWHCHIYRNCNCNLLYLIYFNKN